MQYPMHAAHLLRVAQTPVRQWPALKLLSRPILLVAHIVVRIKLLRRGLGEGSAIALRPIPKHWYRPVHCPLPENLDEILILSYVVFLLEFDVPLARELLLGLLAHEPLQCGGIVQDHFHVENRKSDEHKCQWECDQCYDYFQREVDIRDFCGDGIFYHIHQHYDLDYGHQHEPRADVQQKEDEVFAIPKPHAVVDPGAVVIHVEHARPAAGTMMRALWLKIMAHDAVLPGHLFMLRYLWRHAVVEWNTPRVSAHSAEV